MTARYLVRQETPDTPARLGTWSVVDTATGEAWFGRLVDLWPVDLPFSGDEDACAQLAACLLLCEDAADRWPDTHPPVEPAVMRTVREWMTRHDPTPISRLSAANSQRVGLSDPGTPPPL